MSINETVDIIGRMNGLLKNYNTMKNWVTIEMQDLRGLKDLVKSIDQDWSENPDENYDLDIVIINSTKLAIEQAPKAV